MNLNSQLNDFINFSNEIVIIILVTIVNTFLSVCGLIIENCNLFFSKFMHTTIKEESKYLFLIQNKKKLLIAYTFLNRLIWISLGIFIGFRLLKHHTHPDANIIYFLYLMTLTTIVFMSITFSELIPRELLQKKTISKLKFLIPVIRLIDKIMIIPVVLSTSILKLFNKSNNDSFLFFNSQETEIKKIIESVQETGEIKNDDKYLLNSVLDFHNIIVRQIMTPRVDLHSVSVETKNEDFFNIIAETGRSRIPIYEETDDQIIGIIHAKDVLIAQSKKTLFTLKEIARPAYFVHENKGIQDLLKEFQKNRVQIAIVQDEFGGTAGIVTVEDIVEELVGEIIDEYDKEEFLMEENQTGYLVDGKTPSHHLSHYLPYPIENNNFDTIGGYVFGLFGKKPKQGEKISDTHYEFEVQETDGKRILKLHIRPLLKLNQSHE